MKFIQKASLPFVAVVIVLIIVGAYMYSQKAEAPEVNPEVKTEVTVMPKPKTAATPATTSQVTVVKFPEGTPDVQASAFPVTGPVALAVKFTVPDVSGVDYEGRGIYYSIVYGDGQAGGFPRKPPFTITHNYTSVGSYTAVVTLSTQCGVRECLGPTKIVSTFKIFVNSGLTQ